METEKEQKVVLWVIHSLRLDATAVHNWICDRKLDSFGCSVMITLRAVIITICLISDFLSQHEQLGSFVA